MALRSLGTTLLAKTNPGTALRTKEEQNVQGAVPAANTSAQPNAAVRKTVDQPMEVSVPGGTEKSVAVKPTIQPNVSTTQPATGIQGQGLLPQMGGAVAATNAGRNINAPVAPSSAGNVATPNKVAAPISAPVGAKSSTSVSSGGRVASAAVPNSNFLSNVGVGAKNAPAETNVRAVSVPFTGIGSRVSAAEDGGKSYEVGRSLPQAVAATVANIIDKGVVNAVKNIGKTNYTPTSNVSRSLMQFASNPSAAKSSGILSNISSAANTAKNTASNVVQKASSWLRSLFK